MSETRTPTTRTAVPVLWAGLAATLLVTAYAWVDSATSQVLAGHVAASYPAYGAAEVDAAVAAYLAILTILGVLGTATWAVVARAARSGRAWAPLAGTVALVLAVGTALVGLTTRDTSGDVGLAPALGWAQLLPCAVGLVAVALLWRRR
ncbi:hypothetical protein ACFQBY_18460 [Promicromonospora citrea]|uniref:Uncharacterized protein n=1 Tax=Promicromonospora citrea TaxID=43677 RepID=A0A8H9GHP7_9MICO|nr:hypothetical protein [Promicromonospora citrea]NNH53326.1 hypothetical protein [Promicromonospora citrea]GGM23383.1 hypothetical protein GCM10010102_18920 [Promicromonospora citrea]